MWRELSITVPPEYVEPIAYLFARYGHGLSIEDAGDNLVRLRTYLANTSKRRLARIEVGVNLVRLLQPSGELEIKELAEVDWESAWKAHFGLLRVGRNLVIKPSWIAYDPSENDVVVELDPGMAFGTGYHPSTSICLEALEALVRPKMDMIDLGTGSGILAIAAAKLGAGSVLALDIDPTAVKVARNNFRSAGLSRVVRLARGTLPHPLAYEAKFALATANISAKTIQGAAPYLWHVLRPGGMLIASGIIENQAGVVEETLGKTGFCLQKVYRVDDWVGMLLSRGE